SDYNIRHKNNTFKLKYYDTYSSAIASKLFLITGSCDTLEFSVKNGSAFEHFPVELNEKIEII
ncbi:hypothetical protein JYT51_00825, partial [Candidatus Amoebophilus asiaticus]|nr:hypothetical protein [Candidatus Amoebophilus asiaticus]